MVTQTFQEFFALVISIPGDQLTESLEMHARFDDVALLSLLPSVVTNVTTLKSTTGFTRRTWMIHGLKSKWRRSKTVVPRLK